MTFLGISYFTHRAGCHPLDESWGSGMRSKAVFQRVHKGKILLASFPKGLTWCGRATLLRLTGGRENLGWVSLQWGHGASSLCIYTSCQPSHSWFLCAEMSVGFYPMSSAPCPITDFRYVWGFSETCSRSSRALIYLLIECTFVLVQSFAFAVFSDLGLIWDLHSGSSAIYGAKTEQLPPVEPLVSMCECLYKHVFFLSNSFFLSSFPIWFCFAFYLQCVVLLWVLLMHVELGFPKESVWHWKIKVFLAFALSKPFIISWGFCFRVVGCWEELKYGTAENQLV